MPIEATSKESIDTMLADLRAAAPQFVTLTIQDRVQILHLLAEGVEEIATTWVKNGAKAKGIHPESPLVGEEWLAGPVVMQRNLRLLRESLEQIAENGSPKLPKNAIQTKGSRTTVRVFPTSSLEKVLFQGFSADVHMEDSVSPQDVQTQMGGLYRSESDTSGGVALVLGAGNVSSIGPLDAVHKLFVENQVCVLKMNPVNEYLGPILEQAFQELIKRDFLRVVYGGADVGAYLCEHDEVDSIHITGSDQTHDAIVWGPPGSAREEAKRSGTPKNKKPITSELGNVSPIVVVPGPWTKKELAFQARNIATMLVNNASFNCNAAKLLIQQDSWDQKDAFLDEIGARLQSMSEREAYYAGATDRYDRFLTEYPQAKLLGERTETNLPWAIIRDVDSAKTDNLCFTTEAFCPILAATQLDAQDPVSFLNQAVSFCNEHVWGTLNVSLLIHPKTMKDPAFQSALDEAIESLRYGTIVINHWAGLGFGFGCTPWGAHPGHSLDDVQSGIGFVHNTFLLERVQKTVIRGPFTVSPTPPWFADHKNMHNVGRKMAAFEKKPSWLKVPSIVASAIRG